jgi:hypothetical protein
MASRIMQERSGRVSEMAAALGAKVIDTGEANEWDLTVSGKRKGQIRYEPRARVWLGTTGTESTAGDLEGCLQFVIRRS